MKSSVKTLVTLLSLSLVPAAATLLSAQDATPPPPASDAAPAAGSADQTPPPPRKGKGKGKRGNPIQMVLAKVDNVTDDEKSKVEEISQAQMQKMRDLRQDTSLSDDDRRTKMQAMMKDTLAQVRAVLTPDQQKQFDDAVASMPQMGRGKKKAADGGDAPPPPPANN